MLAEGTGIRAEHRKARRKIVQLSAAIPLKQSAMVMYDFSNLSSAVTYWLNYKKLTGLDDLFSEASLVVPIAEFLTTKSVPQLRSEITHPIFKSRRVDFVGYSKHGRWIFVIEAKYLPSTPQSIANDLARLLLLDKDNCERFMVIGLPVEPDVEPKQAFTLTMNVGRRRINMLRKFFSRTKNAEQVVHINKLELEIAKLFRKFMDDYDVDNMPNAFQTKCVRFRRTGEFATGMWRVSARKGTGSINKSDL